MIFSHGTRAWPAWAASAAEERIKASSAALTEAFFSGRLRNQRANRTHQTTPITAEDPETDPPVDQRGHDPARHLHLA